MLNFYSLTDSITIIAAVYIINILLIFTVIFSERKSPAATLAWIMVLTFIPIIGFLFYIVFNQNISRSKINKLSDNEAYVISNALRKQMEDMDKGDYEFNSSSTEDWKHLIKLNHVYGHSYYSQNNDVELFTDGKSMYSNFLEDIKNAKEFVNIEFFILKNDHVGGQFIDVLTEKAKEGVTVRLLVDALGSRHINNHYLKDYLKSGGKVGYFFKPKLKVFGIKFNYRNHRKIAVIDNKVAYTGGYNIAKEYLGEKKKFGNWRDTHVRLIGDCVFDINARFILDWRFTTKENIEMLQESVVPSESTGNMGVQIVSCGPEAPAEEVKRAFMRMITYAKKNVYIQTPYFVPDPSIFESLKMAAQSGIDVRVMIPHMPDHVFVYWATYSYVGDLLRSGVRAFIYDDGFLHAKTLVVDGQVGTVGSTNFDIRSFRLNFETNAFVFDEKFARNMENTFEEDIKSGHELTLEEYNKRSPLIKFKEAISRLLADIL